MAALQLLNNNIRQLCEFNGVHVRHAGHTLPNLRRLILHFRDVTTVRVWERQGAVRVLLAGSSLYALFGNSLVCLYSVWLYPVCLCVRICPRLLGRRVLAVGLQNKTTLLACLSCLLPLHVCPLFSAWFAFFLSLNWASIRLWLALYSLLYRLCVPISLPLYLPIPLPLRSNLCVDST